MIELRGEAKRASVDQIDKTPWNPNVVSPAEMDALRASLKRQGQVAPLIVRSTGDGRYQVLDGHHRLDVLVEAGMTGALVHDLGELSDAEAKHVQASLLTVRGQPAPDKFQSMLDDLLDDGMSVEDVLDGVVLPPGVELGDVEIVDEFQDDEPTAHARDELVSVGFMVPKAEMGVVTRALGAAAGERRTDRFLSIMRAADPEGGSQEGPEGD